MHRSSDVITREEKQLGRTTPEGKAFAWETAAKILPTIPYTPPPRPQGPRRVAAAGQGHWSQAQSQWAAAAAWLRNLVVSGRPKEPCCLPCVYLAPQSSWELDLCGDLAWVTLSKKALTSYSTPKVIWENQDQEHTHREGCAQAWCRPAAFSGNMSAALTVGPNTLCLTSLQGKWYHPS